MDYDKLPEEWKKYVKKSRYEKLGHYGRKGYLKGIKHVVRNFCKEEVSCVSIPSSDDIFFVGMKYSGNHQFSTSDELLSKDEKNPDPNSVMVLVKKDNNWVHVAYVTKEDAGKLRGFPEFDTKELMMVKEYPDSMKYKIFVGV